MISKSKKFVFVGENPSPTAIEKNWSWKDGRLAAKQLFDALIKVGICPQDNVFINIFLSDGKTVDTISLKKILQKQTNGFEVVAMGNKVEAALQHHNISCIKIVHPAARGTIRKKENYTNHIRKVLII